MISQLSTFVKISNEWQSHFLNAKIEKMAGSQQANSYMGQTYDVNER